MQTDVILSLGVLRHLPYFLESENWKMVKEACWLLSNITAGTPDQIQAVIDAGFVSRVVASCVVGKANMVRKEAFWTILPIWRLAVALTRSTLPYRLA